MDSKEDELITHVAAGTDILTALAVTADDDKPPKQYGCLSAVLLIIAGIITWALAHAAGL